MQEQWRREGILFISKLIQIPKGNFQNLFICLLQINMVMKKIFFLLQTSHFQYQLTLAPSDFCYQRSGGSNTISVPELILLSNNDIMNKVPDCRRSCAVNSFCFGITILNSNAMMHYFNRFMSNTVLFSASQEKRIHMRTLLSFFPVWYLTMEPIE